MGMSSLLTCGRPICRPLALAFSIPDRTRERIIAKHFLRNCTHCYLDIIEHLFYNMDTRKLEHLFANMQAPFRSQPTGASGGDADGAHDPAL